MCARLERLIPSESSGASDRGLHSPKKMMLFAEDQKSREIKGTEISRFLTAR